jgi:Tfp pilus assembly protein PilN
MINRVKIAIALWVMVLLSASVHAHEHINESLDFESSALECQFCDTYQFVSSAEAKTPTSAVDRLLIQRQCPENVKQVLKRAFLARAPPKI